MRICVISGWTLLVWISEDFGINVDVRYLDIHKEETEIISDSLAPQDGFWYFMVFMLILMMSSTFIICKTKYSKLSNQSIFLIIFRANIFMLLFQNCIIWNSSNTQIDFAMLVFVNVISYVIIWVLMSWIIYYWLKLIGETYDIGSSFIWPAFHGYKMMPVTKLTFVLITLKKFVDIFILSLNLLFNHIQSTSFWVLFIIQMGYWLSQILWLCYLLWFKPYSNRYINGLSWMNQLFIVIMVIIRLTSKNRSN